MFNNEKERLEHENLTPTVNPMRLNNHTFIHCKIKKLKIKELSTCYTY